jgi:uncharacterized membrane protein
MSDTVRRSLDLGAHRPLTARAAAILALLTTVGALACGTPTSPQDASVHQSKRYSVSSTGAAVDRQSGPSDTTSRTGSVSQTNSIMPWF